jgi:hypothetical protein
VLVPLTAVMTYQLEPETVDPPHVADQDPPDTLPVAVTIVPDEIVVTIVPLVDADARRFTLQFET